jgi:hypothetical protein
VNLVTALVPVSEGVLGQLSWDDKADSSLDLAGGDGGFLVVASQLGCLGGNHHFTIASGGVHPNFHAVLLPKKTSKKEE